MALTNHPSEDTAGFNERSREGEQRVTASSLKPTHRSHLGPLLPAKPSRSWILASKASSRSETDKISTHSRHSLPHHPPHTEFEIPQLQVGRGSEDREEQCRHKARTSISSQIQQQQWKGPIWNSGGHNLMEMPKSQQWGRGYQGRELNTAGNQCVPSVWSLSTPKTKGPFPSALPQASLFP